MIQEVEIQSPGDVPKEKKRKGTLVTFPNKKNKRKFLSHPLTYSIPVPVQSSSPGGVPKRKKRKGTFSNVPKSKKKSPHSTHHSIV
jgi:hypothetical protein